MLAAHSSFVAGALAEGTLVQPYVLRLEAAVTVFFVTSGFLIYRPFVRARMRGEPRLSTRAYAWRRFLRVGPAYWVALTLTGLWIGTAGLYLPAEELFSASGAPRYYGFAQLYWYDTLGGGLPHAWSLCVEVAFYALLPLYALAMRALPGRRGRSLLRGELAGVGLLVALSVAYKAVVLLTGAVDRITFSPVPILAALPGYMDHLALGMLLAILSVWYEGRAKLPAALRPVDRFPGLSWLVALVAFWFISTQIGLEGSTSELYTPAQYMERHLLNAIIAVAFVAPVIFGDQRRGLVRRVLRSRVLLYLGLISYGFYGWHLAVIVQLERWGYGDVTIIHPYIQWMAAGVAGSALLGTLSWYLIERPALSLKWRLGPRQRGPRRPAGEPPPVELAAR